MNRHAGTKQSRCPIFPNAVAEKNKNRAIVQLLSYPFQLCEKKKELPVSTNETKFQQKIELKINKSTNHLVLLDDNSQGFVRQVN